MAENRAGGADEPLVIFTPSGRRGRVPKGTTVLEAARLLGADLDSVCGGRGICSKCQVAPAFGSFPKHGVTVTEDALSEWNAVEARYDAKRGLAPGRRLGCQARILGDVVIDIPPESQVHRQVVRKRADTRPVVTDPATRLHYVEVAEPDMEHPSGDLERLLAALAEQWGIEGARLDRRLLPDLQRILREGRWAVTAAVHHDHLTGSHEIIALWPGFGDAPLYGVAIDVGSTTIACHLTELATGEVAAAAGAMNPQIRFGEDLMSRVSWAMMNPGGAAEMTAAVRDAIHRLIGEVAAEAGLAREEIVEAVFVGNPIMHHLLLGIDPKELGWAPFALATSSAQTLPAEALGLGIHPGGRVYVLPLIAGHVGADCAAVILSEGPHQQDEMMLILDVGTNAEIVLGNRKRLLACSSPTGPAFEGAQISAGQRAAPGAIERVRIDPATKEPRFRVIGCDLWSDEPGFAEAVGPAGVTGICGSGIIEAVAEMRMAGLIDEDGAIASPAAVPTPRLEAEGRTFSYVLHDARAAGGRRIAVTQDDVRAIQLAKAAAAAGARLLMDRMGVETVDRVVLAGAFGAHISPLHAMVLGMIPDCPLDRVSAAGNAAGTGARIALVNLAARREIEAVVRRVEKVETATEERFQEHFVAAIAIPHKSAAYPNLARAVTLPSVSFAQGAQAESPAGSERRRRRRRARE